jgi:hypothetical protein
VQRGDSCRFLVNCDIFMVRIIIQKKIKEARKEVLFGTSYGTPRP